MSKRRSTANKRCLRCKIHKKLCFCESIFEIKTKTPVSIIMHHREIYLTSNTANLASLVLPNCHIFLRGLLEKPFHIDSLNLTDEETPLYLFPHENARLLSLDFMQENAGKKFHLIVPDGSWTQAIKCYRRENFSTKMLCVKLPEEKPGEYRLRKSSSTNRLSTYEAIARALGILEKNPALTTEMDTIFQAMVKNVILGRTAFRND